MSLARIFSRAHLGIHAPSVEIEVHISNGLPALSIVGMAATAVKESRDRVRSALINSHFQFPARRITVSLAPADLPKNGGQFDLPIALGILAASGQLTSDLLSHTEFLGELALDGGLRSVPGCLPAAIASQKQQHQLICPIDNAPQAALCDNATVFGARSILDVCAHLKGETPLKRVTPNPKTTAIKPCLPDLSDVRGQHQAKRALEIAAAGRHHILFYGPPGTGKSMLASRLPGLLPPLTRSEAIEVACIQSVLNDHSQLGEPQRPFACPHHTASATALVGGGSQPRPGEISLAHHGVLFLDELPEFQRQVLEVLREPLETGSIRISRASAQVEYPARFQLIAAMNPCPCGYFGDPNRCRCSVDQVRRYRLRLSGPLLDRIDLQVPVLPLQQGELYGGETGEPSAAVQARTSSAYDLQQQRQGCSNNQLSANQLQETCPLTKAQQQLLENAMLKMGFSTRVLHRIIKVARTIADLEGQHTIENQHLMEAFSYRGLDKAVQSSAA